MDPRPDGLTPPENPYAPRQPTDAEHDWYVRIAFDIAAQMATAMAQGEFRRGTAHRYLAAAHLAALLDGAGPDTLTDFLNALVEDFGIAVKHGA